MFNKNRLSVKKEKIGNHIKFYINYYKVKEPNKFSFSLITDLIGENQSLIVVDSNLNYKHTGISVDDEFNQLMKFLEEHAVGYKNVITKGESNASILGISIKLNTSQKVKIYKVGFVISSEDLEKIESILNMFNVFYYIILNDTNSEELLNKFKETRGDMEELNEMFEYNIYDDKFTNQIRICSNIDQTEFIEETLKKHD